MATTPVTPKPEGTPPAAPGTQPDPAVARLESELNRTRQQFATFQRQVMAQAAPPQQPGPDKKQLEKEFIQNPLEMSAAIAQRVVAEAESRRGVMGFDTMVEMARKIARDTDPTNFDRYDAEISAHVMQVDPQFRTNSTYWVNALKLVKGNHIDDIIAAARTQQDDTNRAPAVHIKQGNGPAPAGGQAPPPKQQDQLTDDERKWAKKFRLSEAEYLQGKKDNQDQTDIILNPLGPSSWDKHVTFSSRDKRRAEREAQRAKK